MKKLFLSFVVLAFLFPILHPAMADEHLEEFGWSTGTIVKLKAELTDSVLQTGSHDITFHLTVLDAVFLLNSRVFILINGEETMRNDFAIFKHSDIGTTTGHDSFTHTFQYNVSWGETPIEIKFYCSEFYSMDLSIPHETNWYTFFTITPFIITIESTTSTSLEVNGSSLSLISLTILTLVVIKTRKR
jgi:hypothetical protein